MEQKKLLIDFIIWCRWFRHFVCQYIWLKQKKKQQQQMRWLKLGLQNILRNNSTANARTTI